METLSKKPEIHRFVRFLGEISLPGIDGGAQNCYTFIHQIE